MNITFDELQIRIIPDTPEVYTRAREAILLDDGDFWQYVLGEGKFAAERPKSLTRPCRFCGCGEDHHLHYTAHTHCSLCGRDVCSYYRRRRWWNRSQHKEVKP